VTSCQRRLVVVACFYDDDNNNNNNYYYYYYTVFQKKTSTHIIGYKLRNSCLILIIFAIKILHII